MVTDAKNLPETAVTTEGEAFNAPTSTRPKSDSLAASDMDRFDDESPGTADPHADDLAEQLSRMNSDFEDSLDTHRQKERQSPEPAGFAGLVCRASRATAAVCADVHDFAVRNPFTVAAISAGLAFAFGRRSTSTTTAVNRSVD